VTDSWVKQGWQEFQLEGLEVTEQTANILPARIDDQYLTTLFHDKGFRKKTLFRLNRCRLRLQVMTLADIILGDGRYLLHAAFQDGFPNPNRKYPWPNQGALPAGDWALWKRALRKLCSVSNDLKLPIPLGRRLETAPPAQAYHDPLTLTTLVKSRHQWKQFRHQPVGINQARTFCFIGYTTVIPPRRVKL
jgi:hypothetical protein